MSSALQREIDRLNGDDQSDPVDPIHINTSNWEEHVGQTGVSLDVRDITVGVSLYWMQQTLGMSLAVVKRKLGDLQPIRKVRNGYVFSLPQAMERIFSGSAASETDIARYLANLTPEQLPPKLNKDYWAAKRIQQTWEREARETWRDEDVLEVFATAMMRIKDKTNLWAMVVEKELGLTEEQRKLLVKLSDHLLDETQRAMVEMPKLRRTRSVADIELDKLEGIE